MRVVGFWLRVAVVAGTLVTLFDGVTASVAHADIYLRRDRFGVLHFTNVPTDKRYKRVIREAPPSLPIGLARPRGKIKDSGAYDPIIADVSRRFRVDQALIKAVIRAESAFQADAVSPKGARGLMQLMPGTAQRHGVRNIHEPAENIQGGVTHLRMLLDRYKGNVVLALAAYNAGEGWVDHHGGIPPFQETRDYVTRVLQFRQQYLQHQLASLR
jgi:soluble lytic murein transglycosylase-like protein